MSDYSPAARNLVAACTLLAAFMTQLDVTIVTVALPQMQASTSASAEQITWVLTSYIIMTAVFTPLSGWLASRFGRRRLMVASVAGFTIASMLCGMALNFEQLIAFRMLQGICGAALLPMSQAIMLDITPPEHHGRAMSLWGMGAVLGPILGPVLGGWLTENLDWRWVFFINLPFGVAAVAGLLLFMRESVAARIRFDFTGFALLAIAVGSFQLMLDRGQMEDWFESPEIVATATLAALCLFLVVVHSLTAREPFVKPRLFADRNYVLGSVFALFLGGSLYGTLALLPPMLSGLFGYPIETIGLVAAPRGLSIFVTMMIVGRIVNRVDLRLLIFSGLILSGVAAAVLAGGSLQMDARLVIVSGVIQGIGAGLMFVPVTVLAFATIAPADLNEGAAMNSLIRNLSGSSWIAMLQIYTLRGAQEAQARLVDGVTPDNPLTGFRLPELDFGAPASVAQLAHEVARQAAMIAYVDSFALVAVVGVAIAPLVLLVRRPRAGAATPAVAID